MCPPPQSRCRSARLHPPHPSLDTGAHDHARGRHRRRSMRRGEPIGSSGAPPTPFFGRDVSDFAKLATIHTLCFTWFSVSLRSHILLSARPPRSAIHSVPNFIAQQKHPPQCGQWSSGRARPTPLSLSTHNRPAPKPARTSSITSAVPALASPVLSSSHFLLPPRPPLRLCALTALA